VDRLEQFVKKGWIFLVWLSEHGGCIIQGKVGVDPDDFAFDVQAGTFDEALKMALAEVDQSTQAGG
jgi:hypothetical protein